MHLHPVDFQPLAFSRWSETRQFWFLSGRWRIVGERKSSSVIAEHKQRAVKVGYRKWMIVIVIWTFLQYSYGCGPLHTQPPAYVKEKTPSSQKLIGTIRKSLPRMSFSWKLNCASYFCQQQGRELAAHHPISDHFDYPQMFLVLNQSRWCETKCISWQVKLVLEEEQDKEH